MNYTNSAKSIDEQIRLLRRRGLKINNVRKAKSQLTCISYFRLACYLKHLEIDANHTYKQGATFAQTIALYNFDGELRNLIFSTIQPLEIALRTKIIQHFSTVHGPHWFMDAALFKDPAIHRDCLRSLRRELKRSNEDYIAEYFRKYSAPAFPPAWKTLEVASFGTLSKLFCNFKDSATKTAVAREFGSPHYKFLESWIKAATVLRNCCAHHARVWNRRFAVMPMLPATLPNPWLAFIPAPTRRQKLYSQLCYLAYIDQSLTPNNRFATKLKQLLKNYPNVDLSAMGFPSGWESERLWKMHPYAA